MLLRRLESDDGKGVEEPLDEKVCVNDRDICQGLMIRGNYYMNINKLGEGANWRRKTGQEIYSPLVLAFTHENMEKWTSSHLSKASTMDSDYSLPPNVALITLQEFDNGSVLLRLAHLYEASEDREHSTMAKVELKKMFTGKQILEVKEVSLSANQDKSEMKKMEWKVDNDSHQTISVKGGAVNNSTLVVELGPMEI